MNKSRTHCSVGQPPWSVILSFQKGKEPYFSKARIVLDFRLCDDLHTRVLKEHTSELILDFAHLFPRSIDVSKSLKTWTLVNVCPYMSFKSAKACDCSYRLVSLTYIPCKLLKQFIWSDITAYGDEHKLPSNKQHTVCKIQLTSVMNTWSELFGTPSYLIWHIFWWNRKMQIIPTAASIIWCMYIFL